MRKTVTELRDKRKRDERYKGRQKTLGGRG